MAAVVTPAYMPSIYYMSWLIRQEKILLDTGRNYQKQSYRNRTEIYGANGRLILSIPISHFKEDTKQKDAETEIFQPEHWQKQHWKSILSAYRSSPYFEFYENELQPIFEQNHTHLMDLNIVLIKTLIALLDPDSSKKVIELSDKESPSMDSFLLSKKTVFPALPPYKQVFDDKHGFINNLSCIDLLFNLGPESHDYLMTLELPFSSPARANQV